MALMEREDDDYKPDKFSLPPSDAEQDADYDRWVAKWEREQANRDADEQKEYDSFIKKLDGPLEEDYDPDAFESKQRDIERQSEYDQKNWGQDWEPKGG